MKGLFRHGWPAVPGGVQPTKQKPWGQTVGYVRDPDGFLVEICSPI
jgi:hypothetical protein